MQNDPSSSFLQSSAITNPRIETRIKPYAKVAHFLFLAAASLSVVGAFSPRSFVTKLEGINAFSTRTKRSKPLSWPPANLGSPSCHTASWMSSFSRLKVDGSSYWGSNSNKSNSKDDLYKLLGVSRLSGLQEIKAAYRRLAKQYHPDANRGRDTSSIFQEICRAYEVLSDPEKRRDYNLYGNTESGPEPASPDEHFTDGGFGSDVGMNDVFGSTYRRNHRQNVRGPANMGGRGTANVGGGGTANVGAGVWMDGSRQTGFARGPAIGEDVRMDLEIDFKTSIAGGEHTIQIDQVQTCSACSGNGTGKDVVTCNVCNGSGSTADPDSTVWQRQEQVCYACHGTGKIQLEYCQSCQGQGITSATKLIKINIPPGVENGSRILVCGEGSAGPMGGPPGDLYLYFRILEDSLFRREGADIHTVEYLSCVDAMLGLSLVTATVDGDVRIDIPPGTQPGQVIRIRGKGAPRNIHKPNERGDHIVTIQVQIPTVLSSEEQAAMRQLQQQQQNGHGRRNGHKTPTATEEVVVNGTGFGNSESSDGSTDSWHKAQLDSEREAREKAEERFKQVQIELNKQKAEADRLMKAWKDESQVFSKLLQDARAELANNHDQTEKNFSKLVQQIADLEDTNEKLNLELELKSENHIDRNAYESEVRNRQLAEEEAKRLRQHLVEMEEQVRVLQETLQETERSLNAQIQAALSDPRKTKKTRKDEQAKEGIRFTALQNDYESLGYKHSALEKERDALAMSISELELKLKVAKEGLHIHKSNEEAAKQATEKLQQQLSEMRQKSELDASALEVERKARLDVEKNIKSLQDELSTLITKQAQTAKELASLEAERERRIAAEKELLQMQKEMDLLKAEHVKAREEMTALESEGATRQAVEQEMRSLQEEMENLLLQQAQALEEENELAKTSVVTDMSIEEMSSAMDHWDISGEEVKEVEKLKVALQKAMGELETTRSVLREAINRVDASDLRSGKLEEELLTLKTDLQLVSTTVEEMRTTTQFARNGAFVDDFTNGHSNLNGHTNGRKPSRGGWRPFDFPSAGSQHM